MARPLLTLVLPLMLVAYAAIVAVCSRPYDASELSPLLSPPSGCAMPCWAGIQPGTTPPEDALTLLQRNPWVTDPFMTLNTIDWTWSGQQPAMFDTSSPFFQGRMELSSDTARGTVLNVVMRTRLTFGSVWMALGKPDQVVLFEPQADRPLSGLLHLAVYRRFDLYVFSRIDCPAHPDEFWAAPVDVAFGAPNLPYTELANESPYRLPDWFFRNGAPGCGA